MSGTACFINNTQPPRFRLPNITASTIESRENFARPPELHDEDKNRIREYVDNASKILQIDCPRYNQIMNNKIYFPLLVPLTDPMNRDPIGGVCETYESELWWHCEKYVKHDEGELYPLPVYRGTIHDVNLWKDRILTSCLFEIQAQAVGFAQKNPNQPPGPGNEINVLIRDCVLIEPVVRVVVPHFLMNKFPEVKFGNKVKCVGTMLEYNLMRALRVVIVENYKQRLH